MLRKVIALLLVLSFIFSFTGCFGGEDMPETTESTTESTTQVQTVKVTIPEGYTLVKISWLLEEKGLCTSQEFIDACQTYDEWLDLTQYPFLSDLQNAENVCFYLEGYFFPLTYDIPETATAQDIVKMFLNGTKQKFNDMFMLSVNESRFNLHELLTLASLIEKEAFLDEQRTMIFYEAPHKLMSTLRDMLETFGDRRIALCRELTKIHEEIYRTTFTEAIARYEENPPRGEFVIVIEGKKAEDLASEKEAIWKTMSVSDHIEMYIKDGMTEKDALKAVAKDRGVSKRDIYNEYKR